MSYYYAGQPGQPAMAAPPVVMGFPSSFVLRYTPNEEPNLDVPYELKSFFKEDVWAARIPAITRAASRYYKKGIEWVWLIVSFAALLGVPIAIYYVALHNLPEDADDKKDDDDDHDHWWHWHGFDRVWKARLISLAVWVALMLLVFVPMHLWKKKGKTEVNMMIQKWEAEDRAVLPPGAPYPTLKMKMPGVISKNIKIAVSVPAGPAPSMYQPGSQVPPYLANPPSDPEAANYYQQPPQMQQQQPTGGQWGPPSAGYGARPSYNSEQSNYSGQQQGYNGQQQGYNGQPQGYNQQQQQQGFNGPQGYTNNTQMPAVPMYNARDEQVPGYHGFPTAHTDEKNPFEDVKV